MSTGSKWKRTVTQAVEDLGLVVDSLETSGGGHLRLAVRNPASGRIRKVFTANSPSDERRGMKNFVAVIRREFPEIAEPPKSAEQLAEGLPWNPKRMSRVRRDSPYLTAKTPAEETKQDWKDMLRKCAVAIEGADS